MFMIPKASRDAPHRTELLIKRSRFLTQTAHVSSLEDGRVFVEHIRQLNTGATHNCWACVGGAAGDTGHMACSDDGEPHGTAGRPMLQVLAHSGIGEVCVVVTRWFGGIKLGTGGLVRAYQDSVRENLATLVQEEKRELEELTLCVEYQDAESVQRLLTRHGGCVHACDYAAEVLIRCSVPKDDEPGFMDAFSVLTRGSGIVEHAASQESAGSSRSPGS